MKVLIVEDEEILRVALSDDIIDAGFDAKSTDISDSAIKLMNEQAFDAVITDLRLPGKSNGIGILEHAKSIDPRTVVIVMTAYGSVASAVEALKKGADDYLTKPFESEELIMVLNKALKVRKLEQENIELRERLSGKYQFRNLIGISHSMQEIFKKLAVIAPTEETILIIGETGTGKERVATTIHENSNRKTGPFIAVSCAALSPQLLESELFGYERGAFTGAFSRKIGRFELANNGTIFLDDVDDIPPPLQVKLLRVIQERVFERVGGIEQIKLNSRIISSAKPDLFEKVKTGAFREDLYYRLNVIPVELPPLRERKDDIPPLIEYFLALKCKSYDRVKIEPEAVKLLMEFDWPGNVRQLKHLITRICVLSQCDIISADMIPDEVRGRRSELASNISWNGKSLDEAITLLEKRMLQSALKETNGNKTKAANLLELKPSTFRDKLQKYNLN